jgi:hypothetical protein
MLVKELRQLLEQYDELPISLERDLFDRVELTEEMIEMHMDGELTLKGITLTPFQA